MSRRPRQPREPSMRADARRNRDKILAAAGAVVAEAGADASLEEIARRAGVGSATLHRHFSGRADLLQAMFRDRIATLCDRAEALADADDPDAALVSWLRELVSHAAATRGLAAALMEVPASGRRAHPHRLIRQAGQRLLSRAQADGSVDAGIAIDDVLHLANGVATAAASMGDANRGADALMAIVIDGLIGH
jgi:AcrR family transcriptional regulator